MTDNIAVLEGYTEEWMANNGFVTFPILVKPGTYLGGEVSAWHMDEQQFIRLAGNHCTFTQYTVHDMSFADMRVALDYANKLYAENGVIVAVVERRFPK